MAFGQEPKIKTSMFSVETPEMLNGKVKEVIRLATPLSKDFELFYTTAFNQNGNEIFALSSNKAAVFDKTIFTYKYDASGKTT